MFLILVILLVVYFQLMSLLDMHVLQDIMLFTFVVLMSMVLQQKLRLKLRERLAKKFVINTTKFTSKSMNGLIVTLIDLVALVLQSKQ